MIRRVPLAVAGLVAAVVTSACSSSGAGTSATPAGRLATGPTALPTTGHPADGATISAIDKAYATFFGSSSSLAQSQAALQHGETFRATLAAEGKSSYAQNSSAKVNSVRLVSPDVAAVTFTITSGGAALLPKAPGYAVKTNGTWQVAAQTFCGLLKVQGNAPPACDDPAVTALPH